MKDALGERMKANYELRTRYSLPRRTYTLLRLDGKGFSQYTRGLNKPFDKGLIEDIDVAIIAMMHHLQGAVFAYTQSDEISVLLTDFETPNTDAWFDGNIQKIVSVASSIMTAEFNRKRIERQFVEKNQWFDPTQAYFDCRAFTIPDRVEVMNYFRWRLADCIRNSVSMVAQANFSHRELQGRSQSDMHEMMRQKGINWATDFTDGEKNGRVIWKEIFYVEDHSPTAKIIRQTPGTILRPVVERHRWVSQGAWVFTRDEGKLLSMIPEPKYDR
jgi:tRNA(His) guanylyltransferase